MFKQNTIIYNKDKYIKYNYHKNTTNTLLALSFIVCVVCAFISHNQYQEYSYKEKNKALDEIKESEYYKLQNPATKQKIDTIINNEKEKTPKKWIKSQKD